MPVTANVAFGRYLRMLREDHGFTLTRVCELSQLSTPVDKATLSRLERGQQGATLAVLIPLGRIYDVSADALIERFELDAECERACSLETEDKSYAELRAAGRRSLENASLKWQAYGLFRAALDRAGIDPPQPGYTEVQERAAARMNLASVARSLGKNRFALHEFQELVRRDELPPGMNTMAIDRIANCYRCLGEFGIAEQFVGDAIAEALQAGDKQTLAFTYFTRASNILDQSASDEGIDDLKRSFVAAREAAATAGAPRNPTLGVNALIKLADAYYQTARYEKAGRVALAARDLSRKLEVASGEAYSEVLLGLLDENRGRNDAAVRRWRRVIELSRKLRNTRLNFVAEFFVFRRAMFGDNRALARAARLRLEKLAPWVPPFLPQLQEFKAMTTADPIDPRAVLRQVSERRG